MLFAQRGSHAISPQHLGPAAREGGVPCGASIAAQCIPALVPPFVPYPPPSQQASSWLSWCDNGLAKIPASVCFQCDQPMPQKWGVRNRHNKENGTRCHVVGEVQPPKITSFLRLVKI
jgi:hypothetical protein